MKRLLIATHNEAKFAYFEKILKNEGLNLVCLLDFGIEEKTPENGETEVENALIKADFYAKMTNLTTLADDMGIYIPALNNEPGVQVRRWGGRFSENISDEDWLDYFLDRIKDVPKEKKQGNTKIARAIVTPDAEKFVVTKTREFEINDEPDWKYYKKGWPLSTLYKHKNWQKMTEQELEENEKNLLIFLRDNKNKIFI